MTNTSRQCCEIITPYNYYMCTSIGKPGEGMVELVELMVLVELIELLELMELVELVELVKSPLPSKI